LEVDKRRQGLREGARALKKQAEAAACDVPVWLELPGGAPVQLPYAQAENWLSSGVAALKSLMNSQIAVCWNVPCFCCKDSGFRGILENACLS
jgi:hypothetical protein